MWPFDGLVHDVGPVGVVAISLGLAVTSTACVSTYAHRYVAHGAIVRIHPVLVAVLRTWIWVFTGTNCRRWAALHVKHHRLSDREGDPHSPQLASSVLRLGPVANWRAYRQGSGDDDALRTHPPAHRGTPDRWDRMMFDRPRLGIGLGLTALMTALGPVPGFAVMYIQAVLYVTNTSIVNGIGHAWGYQRFTNTGARYTGNSFVLALLTAGESFHNNHHGDPLSPFLAHARWELLADWPALLLLAGERVGLVELQPRRRDHQPVARWQHRATAALLDRRRDDEPGAVSASAHRARLHDTELGPVKAGRHGRC